MNTCSRTFQSLVPGLRNTGCNTLGTCTCFIVHLADRISRWANRVAYATLPRPKPNKLMDLVSAVICARTLENISTSLPPGQYVSGLMGLSERARSLIHRIRLPI